MANFLGYLAGGLLKGGGKGLESVAEHRIKEKEKEAETIRQEQMAEFKQGLEDTSWEKRNEITTTRDDKIRAEDLDRKSKEKIESDKRYTAGIEATEQYRKDTLAQKKEQLKQNKQIAINQAKALLSENRFKAYTKRLDKAAEIEAKMIELQTVKANKVSATGLVDPTTGTNKEPMTNDEAIADYQKMLNAYNKETRRLYPELSGANAEAKLKLKQAEAEKKRIEKLNNTPISELATKWESLNEKEGMSFIEDLSPENIKKIREELKARDDNTNGLLDPNDINSVTWNGIPKKVEPPKTGYIPDPKNIHNTLK